MISLSDFSSQLLFSLFEVAAAAVILLFGWYFARVIGWYAAKYFGASGFYSSLKNIELPRIGLIGKLMLPRWIELIAKWWIVLAFVAVSLAIVGFGAASRFLGKALEDSVRALAAIFIFSLAALAAENFPKITKSRFLNRLRDPLFLSRVARIAIWALALLAAAFVAKIIPLKKVFNWGGIILALALLSVAVMEFKASKWGRKLVAAILSKLKFIKN